MSKEKAVKVKNITEGYLHLAGSAGYPVIQLEKGQIHEFSGDALNAYSQSIQVMADAKMLSVDGKEAKASPKDLEQSLIKEDAKAQSIINEPAPEAPVAEEEAKEEKTAKKSKK